MAAKPRPLRADEIVQVCAAATPTRARSHSPDLGGPRPPQYLEENDLLLEAIRQNQNLGRLHECVQYQLQLQQNLVHLAMYADEQPGIQPLVLGPQVAPQQLGCDRASNAAAPADGEQQRREGGHGGVSGVR